MRSCPQCNSTYPDDVAVCTRDGAPLRATDDVSRPIEPTASIPPPTGTEDISIGDMSSASFSSRPGDPTRAGHPRAARDSERPRVANTSMNPEDRIGSTLGSYRLMEVIGRGGMGAVYRAEHVRLPGREVALKLLRADYAQRKDSVARFIREAQSVNRIRHRNIVDISDIAELDDGTTFIIMELLTGDSLGQLLRKPGALNPARSLNLLIQICDGLSAAHEKDIVHRDLKPDNIFVSADNDGKDLVKLLDFGVAKLLSGHEADVSVHTVAGSVIGTPAFMSPEQAGGLQVDSRSDIYSLGAIMYELFSGKPPFTGKSFGEFVRKHLNENPVPLRQTKGGAHVDPRIEAIVMQCLVKDPAHRYQRASDLRAALYDVYAALETHTGQFAQSSPPQEPAPAGPPSMPPGAPPPAVSGPAAATYTSDPGAGAPFPPMHGPPHGPPQGPPQMGTAQPTPPPVAPAGTPPTDSMVQSGEMLPTPPPHTPVPPPAYTGPYPSGQYPAAPVSGQHPAMSGPYAAAQVSGQHPVATATAQVPPSPRSSWRRALILMLGGGAIVGALAGIILSNAAGGSEDETSAPTEAAAAASGPQVTKLSPAMGDVEIRVISEPDGADVFVFRSDEPICKTPCVFTPGEQGPQVRKYVVARAGFRSETIEVDLQDVPPRIDVALEPAP